MKRSLSKGETWRGKITTEAKELIEVRGFRMKVVVQILIRVIGDV